MSDTNEKGDDEKKKDKRGILRLDINKPRNSSGSVEFRNQPELIGEASPSPQSTQLSVKWAFPKDVTSKGENGYDVQVRPERLSSGSCERRAKKSLSADYFGYQPLYYMDPVDYPEYINSEDEDYSLSLSAVIQRRASVKGRKKGYISPRRTSSPMGHVSGISGIGAVNSIVAAKADRRRSSAYTTSSGETAISLGDGTNQDSTKEQIFENIRLHKEVLQSVKMQPWSMRRKLRLVRQAREYIARHEGALQERFAMSRSTKDLWARFKIVLAVKWQHFRRELVNLSTLFVPWQLRIKEIESHFGSVVASYFTFLRWLFWVNIVLASTLSTFVILPEFLASQFSKQNDHRKMMMKPELENATRLTTFLNFEGYLKYSPLFYGYYSDYSGIVRQGYNLPLAYFFAGVAVYIYSFWATLRKMADNSRMSKMSSKEDECIFSWKLFTGWDYMIGHAETAHNRIASVVLGFKEALLEEAEKKKDKQNWKVILLRVLVNMLILCLLVLSASAVVIVVGRSSDQTKNYSYWRRNETSFVMTGITFFFPMCFEFLGYLENYHPRKQLRWQLGRIMLLNLLNLFSLVFALFKKIYLMNQELERLRQCPSHDIISNETTTHPYSPTNDFTTSDFTTSDDFGFSDEITAIFSAASELFTTVVAETTAAISDNNKSFTQTCYKEWICSNVTKNVVAPTIATLFYLNFSTTILPEIVQQMNVSSYEYSSMMPTTFFEFNTTFDSYENMTADTNETEFLAYSTTIANNFTDVDDGDYNGHDENFKDDNDRTTASVDHSYNYDSYDNEKRFRRNIANQLDADEETDYLQYDDDDNTNPDYKTDLNVVDEEETNYPKINSIEMVTLDSYDGFENITEYISSTVTSFLENTTETLTTLEPMNETEIYDLWMNYLTTISTESDTFDTSTEYTTETTDESCYKLVCKNLSTDELTTVPYASDTAEEEEPVPIRAISSWHTTPIPITSSTHMQYTIEPTNTSFVANTTLKPKCVPFTKNGAIDNITGIPPEFVGQGLIKTINKMNEKDQLELRDLCWETIFGQELVKLTVLDLIFTIITTLFMDFFRALFVRFMNKCWCWDLEKKYPKYGDFKIAENILHLVNNQGQVWMGMFFSPGLAILNLVKLGILMYFRSWAVLTCNVPHEVVFRASRSNNFYLALLLTMLFLCVLPVSYAIIWIEPSWHCGPFANHARIHRVFTDTLKRVLPKDLHLPLDIIASPSTVIPLLLLLILIIYYLVSLTGALREANQDLKNQLRRERQEERRKMLQRVVNAKLDDSGGNNAMDRWRKVLEASSPVTPTVPGGVQPEPDEEKVKARREFLARIMKKALRKSSATSEDESQPNIEQDDNNGGGGGEGDETDTENNEPLPHDHEDKPVMRRKEPNASLDDKPKDGQRKKPSFSNLRNIAEVAHRKPDTDDKATVKPTESSVSHFEQDDDDNYNKVNVVSERRALRRQKNANISDETQTSSIATLPGESANFEMINEKEKEQKKPIKVDSPPKFSTSPEIFKFDRKITDNLARQDTEEKDANLKEQKESKPKSVKLPISAGSSVSSKTPSPTTSCRSAASSPRISDKQKTKGDQSPASSPSDAAQEILKQPIRKFGSFLALVREAVQAKKEEAQQNKDKDATTKATNNLPDIQSRVKAFIDDSNSVSVSEEGTSTKPATDSTTTSSYSMTTTTTTTTSKNTFLISTKRKRPRSEPQPKPKRDSQASIRSENIPVITISKSESDECILEKGIDIKIDQELKNVKTDDKM